MTNFIFLMKDFSDSTIMEISLAYVSFGLIVSVFCGLVFWAIGQAIIFFNRLSNTRS